MQFSRRSVGLIRRGLLCGALATACALAAGCKELIPLFILTEHLEKIPAEYDKLAGKKTVICVWAPQEILFDYPLLRMELAGHVADRLRTKVKDIEVVDPRKVEDYFQRTLSLSVDPTLVGREFDAAAVVYIEVTDFHIRDPEAPDVVRAKTEASVTVYDMSAESDEPRQYELQPVKAEYPEHGGAVQLTDTNVIVARKQLYEQFGEMVSRKFYAYEADMQTGEEKEAKKKKK